MKAITAILIALISGTLTAAAFPPYEINFLAWLCLAPLLVVLLRCRKYQAFFCASCYGIPYMLGIFAWVLVVNNYTYLHHLLLGCYLWFLFGLFGFSFAWINARRGPLAALATAPFLWVLIEFARSNLSFLTLPWGLLGYSQYSQATIIQIASLCGPYGVSFLIVMVNAVLALLFIRVITKSKASAWGGVDGTLRGNKGFVFGAFFLVAVCWSYGRIITSKPIEGEKIKVAIIQGNIEQKRKWDPQWASTIMQTMSALTQVASNTHPDLIIWPETATPKAINTDPKLKEQIVSLARQAGAFVLLGSSQLQKFKMNAPGKAKFHNSAFLIPPNESGKEQRYDKIKLLPFGEYLPFEGKFPWSVINVPNVGRYLSGKEHVVFNVRDWRFGTTICWENIFPGLVREFAKNGAQFIVNITNEGWFGPGAASYHFLSMSVFRAVENRVFVVRCANTGISCIIDPYGRIVERLRDETGHEIQVRGVLSGAIVPLQAKTFYTFKGDVFIYASAILCGLVLLATFWVVPQDGKEN